MGRLAWLGPLTLVGSLLGCRQPSGAPEGPSEDPAAQPETAPSPVQCDDETRVKPRLVVQQAHTFPIEGIASADDGRLAVTVAGSEVRVWAVPSGHQVWSLELPAERRGGAPVVSDTGHIAYFRGEDPVDMRDPGSSSPWLVPLDLRTGQLGDRVPDRRSVLRLAHAPSRPALAVGEGNAISFVTPGDGGPTRIELDSFAKHVSFIDDAHLLVVGADDAPMLVEAASGEIVERFSAPSGDGYPDVTTSADGTWFVVHRSGPRVAIYERGRPAPLEVEVDGLPYINGMCMVSEDDFVVGGSAEFTAFGQPRLPSMQRFSRKGTRDSSWHPEDVLTAVSELGCDARAGWILAAHGSELALLSAETGAHLPSAFGRWTPAAYDVEVDETAGVLVVAGSDPDPRTIGASTNTIHVLDAATGHWRRSFGTGLNEIRSVALSRDAGRITVADSTKGAGLPVLDIGGAAKATGPALPPCSIFARLATSDNRGRLVVMANVLGQGECKKGGMFNVWSGRPHVMVFDDGSTEPLFEHTPDERATAMTVSGSGRQLALGLVTGEIELWDLETKTRRRWAAHDRSIDRLAFSADERELAAEIGKHGTSNGQPSLIIGAEPEILFFAISDAKTPERAGQLPRAGLLRYARQPGVVYLSNGSSFVAHDRKTNEPLYETPPLHESITDLELMPRAGIIVTAGTEGTLRYTDLHTGEPRAQIHVVTAAIRSNDPLSRDWVGHATSGSVVVSPSGQFDYGDRSVAEGVHFALGTDVLALNQLVDVFYEPFLLEDLLKGDACEASPALACGLKLPPEVTLSSSRRDGGLRVRVTGADRGGGIASLSLFHNGRAVPDAAAVESGSNFRVYEPTLHPGTNAFVALGRSRDGIKSFSTRLEGPTLPRASGAPNLHVLAVGIGDYGGHASSRERGVVRTSGGPAVLPDLEFAVSDARKIAARLADGRDPRFGEVHDEVLENPTREALLSNIDRLAQATAPQDTAIVFLAGHGVSQRSFGQCADDNEYYFVPTDYGSVGTIAERAVSGRDLLDRLATIPAGEVFLLLDTCQAGTTNRTLLGDIFGALTILGEDAGVHVLAGALAKQAAKESGRLRQGVFTHALLETLDCRAGHNDARLSALRRELDDRIGRSLAGSALSQNVLASSAGSDPVMVRCP